MSLRAAKKLIGTEKTKSKAFEEAQPDSQNQKEVTEDEDPKEVKKIQNAFALLGSDEDEDDENDQSDKDVKDEHSQKINDTESKKNKKNKNKKKKKLEKPALEIVKINEELEEEKKLDEIDEFLNEMKEEQKKKLEKQSCLSININALNYNKELAKFFKGAKLTEGQNNQGNAKENRIMKQLRNNRNLKNFKKFKLVHSDTSLMHNPERFTCKKVGQNAYIHTNEIIFRQGARIFSFEPTQKYLHLQEAHENMKNTYDPNLMMQFVRENPYHVDSLFDIAELMRLQGDYKQTNQLLETILFIYEDSLSYEFNVFEDDDVLLSFDENQFGRTFFLALNRFVNILGKKGCYKSALEYNKFLIRLNPYDDPVGGLLTLDYNAISSKNWDFLLNFPARFGKQYYHSDEFSLIFMPNYLYSVALCKLYKLTEDENIGISEYAGVSKEDFNAAINPSLDTSEQNHKVTLMQAILLYPKIVREIINVNEYTKLTLSLGGEKFSGWQKKSFKDILQHPMINSTHEYLYPCLNLNNNSDIEGLSKLVDIYIERSKLIWKTNQATLLVKACVGLILNEIDGGFNYEDFIEKMFTGDFKYKVPYQMSRYRNLHKSNFSDHAERIDFANIPDNVGRPQNQQNQNMNPINPNSGLLNLLFGSILPWNHLPNQGNNDNNQNDPNNDDELPDDFEINDEDL